MNKQKFEELAELLKSQLDETLDTASKNRLAELLRNDPEAQAFYVEYCQIHAMLAWEHGVLTVDAIGETFDSKLSTTPKPKRPGSRRWQWLAIAATLVLSVSGSWFSYQLLIPSNEVTSRAPGPDSALDLRRGIDWETRDVFAVVSNSHGSRLLVPNVAMELSAGDQVRRGVYILTGGFVELTFINGVEVIIESPASFSIESEMHIVLDSGRLSAKVSELGKGFTVGTPSAEVVDFGTEFAVEVNCDGSGDDEFHVFQGEIVVKPRLVNVVQRVELFSGQATRLDHRTSTPAGIDIDHQRFIRNFDAASLDYHEQVMKLKPDVYYVMQIDGEGQTLHNEVSEQAAAKIYSTDERYLHWSPGFNGGTAFQMNGAKTETYAVAADYPKSQDDRLSVTAWVYAKSRPWWGSIAKNWEQSPEPERRGQFHFGLYQLTGVLEAHINDDDNVEQFVKDTVPFPLNRWQHVAMVADGKVLRLYRNGEEVAATPYNGLNGNPRIKPLAIGNKLGDDTLLPSRPESGYWDGSIDHLAIFNKALTPDQVQQLFETGELSMKNSQTVQKQD